MNLIDATLNIIIAKFDDCKPVCATKYLFKHQTCQEFKLVASELGGEATTKSCTSKARNERAADDGETAQGKGRGMEAEKRGREKWREMARKVEKITGLNGVICQR